MTAQNSYDDIKRSASSAYDFLPATLHNASLIMDENMQNMSNSILESSINVSNALLSIKNEAERSKKLDEYYYLLRKIEKYHKKLFKAGKLQTVYKEKAVSYIKTPLLPTDERSILLTFQYFPDTDMPALKKLIQEYQVSHLKIIEHCLLVGEYTLYASEYRIDAPSGFCLNSMFSYRDEKASYIDNVRYEYNENNILTPQCYETANLLLRTWLTFIKRDTIIENLEKISEFKQFIEKINFDIILKDLRNLSLALQSAVQQYIYELPL